MWIIIAIAWVAVLVAGISLCRIAAYADQKFRRMMARPSRTEDRAA
jgi:hypothetical protein